MALITTDYYDQQQYIGLVGSTTGAFTATLSGAKMILAAAAFAPSKALALAGITQPTYAGYAAQVITWSATAYRDPAGIAAVISQLVVWREAAAITATTVYGYGITNGAGTQLLASELSPTTYGLTDNLTYVGIVVTFPLQVIQTEAAVFTS